MHAATIVLWFGSTQIYVYQNLLSQLELKQKVVKNKWIDGEKIWIKPHAHLIKI